MNNPIMDRRLTFGKHKGQTFAHVAQFDPSYLDWMHGEDLCGVDVIHARDRGEYEEKKLPEGYAIVFTGGVKTYDSRSETMR